MYDFVKMMYEAGCDVAQYLSLGVITAEEYAEIVGGDQYKEITSEEVKTND